MDNKRQTIKTHLESLSGLAWHLIGSLLDAIAPEMGDSNSECCYFLVATEEDSSLVSRTSPQNPPVAYRPGRWRHVRDQDLILFTHLWQAQKYAIHKQLYAGVWRCKVRGTEQEHAVLAPLRPWNYYTTYGTFSVKARWVKPLRRTRSYLQQSYSILCMQRRRMGQGRQAQGATALVAP